MSIRNFLKTFGAIVISVALLASTAPNGFAATACKLNLAGPTRSSAAEETAWNGVFADFEKQYKCTVKATWQGDFTTVPNTLRAAKLDRKSTRLNSSH